MAPIKSPAFIVFESLVENKGLLESEFDNFSESLAVLLSRTLNDRKDFV